MKEKKEDTEHLLKGSKQKIKKTGSLKIQSLCYKEQWIQQKQNLYKGLKIRKYF